MRLPFKLLEGGAINRRTLVTFTLMSAVINGLVTASVGAWLAQTYSTAQTRRASINAIAGMFYERRIKAGMVVSSLRRGADLDEVRYRKRMYDESFVDWNRSIRQNLFAIREVLGEADTSTLEEDFQELLVAPLATIDNCLTKAYDQKLAGQDPKPQLEACKIAEVYQTTLDCGAAFTNELFKLSRVSFNPMSASPLVDRSHARQRVNKICTNLPVP